MRFSGVRGFLIFLAMYLGFLSRSFAAEVAPLDIQNDPEFQYVVKVLQLSDKEAAVERLALSWQNLKNFLAKLKPSLELFEFIRQSASNNLASEGHEVCIAIPIAIFGGAIIECGLGYSTQGFDTGPHLRFGMRALTTEGTKGSFVVAVSILIRKFQTSKHYGRTLLSKESNNVGGFVGLGGFHDKNNSEIGIGIGLGGFSAESKAVGFAVPLFPAVAGLHFSAFKSLEQTLSDIVVDLHHLRFAQAYQKLVEFQQGVVELNERIKHRYIRGTLTADITMHPLASIQNLFEPSLVEMSLKADCRKSLTLIESPKARKALPEGK